jgi:hypothetical protein
MQLDKCKLAGAVNGYEQVESALRRLEFGNINVEKPNWVTLEFLLDRSVTFHLRQAGDAVALQATAQNGSGAHRLECVQAVVQGQQAHPAESRWLPLLQTVRLSALA